MTTLVDPLSMSRLLRPIISSSPGLARASRPLFTTAGVVGADDGTFAEGGPNAAKLLEIAAPTVPRTTWATMGGGGGAPRSTRGRSASTSIPAGASLPRARAIAHRSYFNMAFDPALGPTITVARMLATEPHTKASTTPSHENIQLRRHPYSAPCLA